MQIFISISNSDNEDMSSESARIAKTAGKLAAAVRAQPAIAKRIKKSKENIKKIQKAALSKYRVIKKKKEKEKAARARKRASKKKSTSSSEDLDSSYAAEFELIASEMDFDDTDFEAVADFEADPAEFESESADAAVTKEKKNRAKAMKKRILSPRQKLLRNLLIGAMKTFPKESAKVKALRGKIKADQDKAWKAYVKNASGKQKAVKKVVKKAVKKVVKKAVKKVARKAKV